MKMNTDENENNLLQKKNIDKYHLLVSGYNHEHI